LPVGGFFAFVGRVFGFGGDPLVVVRDVIVGVIER
jgi:hypothetical protein